LEELILFEIELIYLLLIVLFFSND